MSMPPTSRFARFDPCLPDPGAVRDMLARFGPFRSYVEKPIKDGLGKGLTRRHDAILNYYRKRTAAGVRERMDEIAARTNLFRGVFGEPGKPLVEGAEGLWNHAGFIEATASFFDRPLVRPSMLYANILMPGMELAIHTDTPAYRGLDQTNTPEWLLVVMAHSGLFEEYRVPIGAAVAFFSTPVAGEFLVHLDGLDAGPTAVVVRENAAVALDTDSLFHGVARLGGEDVPPPKARMNMAIQWEPAEDAWILRGDGGDEVERFGWDEVRLSFQWKGKCYLDAADERRTLEHEDDLGRDAVSARLLDNLRERGVLGDDVPNDTKLALLMIDTYVKFPTG